MDGSQDDIPPPLPPPPSQTPTQQTPHTVSTIKLHILKKGEYDIWAMKIEHYLAHTDYPIWEVIQNGNRPVLITTDTQGQIKILPPRTAEEILARERERKARTILLMALPEDHLAKFHKMTDAKELWESIKSRFGGNDESKKMQKYILKQQFECFSVSNSEGLHKGYDRFQSLLSQLEIHGAGVSTEDANQKFLRSLPFAWSQVSLIMRTKPGVDSLSFDDLYNNLRVFENNVKGSTASSLSTQNVAFVSENTSSTNDVSTAYGVSNPSGHNSQYEQTSSYSLLANQSSCPQLDHEDLEQLDEFDLEEMDLKWQVAMISMRMKKFYKKTGRKLQFDAKEPVGFDKTKVECYSCHKTGHFARECRTKGNQDSRRRDAWNSGNKDKENGRRSGKQEDSKALVTIDGEGVDWTSHSEEEEDYALMACNSSGSDTEVISCSKECKESYAELKKLYDEQRAQLSDASIEIQAYTQALKKVEAQLVAHQQSQLWYEEKIRFMKIDLDDKTDNSIPSNGARKVNTVKPIVNNAKVNTVKPMLVLLGENGKLLLSPQQDYPHRTLQNKGIVDSGCSRHMTRNKAYLAEYQDFNGGLNYSISISFLVSQMCDKKNKVLFTDTECLVLSPEFKLPDEIQIMLKIPRQNNMYSFNLENIVPSGSLACLIAKATIDESNKWHRRVLVTKPQNKTPYELITGKIPIIRYIRPFGCHVTILNTIDHLGKFDRKSDEGFLVGYSLQSKAYRVYNLETKRVKENLHITFLENKPNIAGKGPTWLFDLDYLTDSINYQPVRLENQTNKHAGPKEANHNVGTEDIIDAGDSEKEAESAQDYFVLPIWSSYSSIVKSSKARNAGEEPNKHPDLKSNEKPVEKEDQEFAKDTEDLLFQVGAAKASITNTVNTASTPVSTVSPYGGLSFTDLTNADQNDSEIPALEEIYNYPTDGIFTNATYDDEGAVADFTNLETIVNVSPIPTSRINSIHPSTLILGDPKLVVQTRSKVTQSSRAHALVDAMQEELLQFKIQKVWILVDLPYGKKLIGTKWVYRNKKDERGVVVRNKARLVAQGHRQEKGINYDEFFALVARIEAIRIFLAFASYMGFIVYQMDVKSVFLYGKIDEAVYVSQPPGFIDPKYPKKSGYRRGTIDKTLFIKKEKNDIMLVQVYVDDIIFGSTKKSWSDEFEALMKVTPKTSHLHVVKRIFRCLKGKPKLGLWYPRVSSFDLEAYSNSDYAGANLDRKSTTGESSIFHSQTKQIAIRAPNSLGWLMNHFIRDAYEKKLIQVLKIHTDDNVADLLTKAFDVSRESLGRAIDGTEALLLPKISFMRLLTFLREAPFIMLSLYITAKVAGKPVSVSGASIRSDLLFDDADGIDSLPNQAIFDAIQLMGYEGDLTVLTFNKALFSPQWRFLFHTMNHCISSKSTSWDQIPTNIATALTNVPVPLDHFPVNALTSKVFSFMVKKGKHFSGKVTPLFSNMLVQPTEDEGEQSERPSEPQPTPSPPHLSEVQVEPQSDPSPRPSPTTHIPDSIPEDSGGNQGGQSSSDKSLSGNEGDMTLQSVYDLCISLCTQVTDQAKEIKHLKAQIKKLKKKAKPVITHHRAWMKSGRKSAKAEPSVHKDPLFDELDDDEIDNMETEDAQDVGRTRNVVYEEKESAKEIVSTDRSRDSTDKEKDSTDKEKDSTDRPDEGTVDQTEGRSATPTTPTPTPTTFGDDETIAQVLLNMSQNKEKLREKEKGVELKDVENTKRPREKKIEEEDESDTESEGIPEAKKKFKQLARDEEIARKVQEDWEAEEEVKKLAEEEATNAALIQDFDDIKARLEADRLLALRLQEEKREQFTVEERAKFLHDTIAAQRRFFAKQRAIAIRNKPPTRTQLRNQMMTYLKHVGNKKHSDLKNKTFEEIQALYEKVKRFDESFTTVGSTEDERKIKEMNEGVKDLEHKRLKKKVAKETPKKEDTAKVRAKVDVTEQATKKRKGGHMKMLARKRKRIHSDVNSDDEHRKCLKIVIFEGTIDSEIIENKSFISKLEKVSSPEGGYLVIYRVNGNFRAFNYLLEYSEITLEGFELILWGDLKIMMESSIEENDQSDFWSDQQDWKIVTWRLYEACGVYILELEDRTIIHMLVERRYPISKDLLQRMLNLGLEVERESTAALDLIRFIKQQINEK
ncbi:putative ribonuclease H-like domain-containing protein [Tanacetum coccineum]